MSEAKHTPGPWIGMVDGKYSEVIDASVDSGDINTWMQIHNGEKCICIVVGRYGSKELDANAALIAAAPETAAERDRLKAVNAELLNALKKCAAVCGGFTMHKQGLIDALESARAAIAKATGEKQ